MRPSTTAVSVLGIIGIHSASMASIRAWLRGQIHEAHAAVAARLEAARHHVPALAAAHDLAVLERHASEGNDKV